MSQARSMEEHQKPVGAGVCYPRVCGHGPARHQVDRPYVGNAGWGDVPHQGQDGESLRWTIHSSYSSFPIQVSISVQMKLARDFEEDSGTSVSLSSASGDDMG